MKATATPEKGGPLTNRDIRAREIQLIDAEGQNRGVMQTTDALQLAEEAGLDLVEIVPNATPPVCKILDFGKFRFLEQKKAAEARKRQKIVEIKEIKLRPGIDDHDYEVKMAVLPRGRERANEGLVLNCPPRLRGEVLPSAKVGAEPLMEGRQMTMV